MKPLNTLIVDDEPLARQILKGYAGQNDALHILGECADGFEALRQIQMHKPDLVLLDIQMPKLDGFELLEVLEYKPVIIFTTAFDQFAIKAFETNAIDYLLKPFSKERFDSAIQKVLQQLAFAKNDIRPIEELKTTVESARGTIDRVVTRLGSKVTVIPVDKIWYLEAADDYVMVYSDAGNHLKEKTMKFFEEHLPPANFIRIHRSYIINMAQIAAIEQYTKDTHLITLKCGAKLRASAEGYKKLRTML